MKPQPPKSTTTPNSAIMLLECIVYLAMVMLIVGLALTAFYHAWNNHRDLDRASQEILQALKAGEQWREDIRQASAPPIHTGSSDDSYSFHIPQLNGEIVYRFQSNGVWRIVARQTNQVQVLERFKTSRVLADRRTHVHAWRWELELPSRRQEVRTLPLFTFLAAPASPTPSVPPSTP